MWTDHMMRLSCLSEQLVRSWEQLVLKDTKKGFYYALANMQSKMAFPSSHQLKSYVAPQSRLKFAVRCPVSRCWPSCFLTYILPYLTFNFSFENRPTLFPGQIVPLPSNRHHRRCGDCLEGKRENYQVCSVQYCVQQLCPVRCTHIWTD